MTTCTACKRPITDLETYGDIDCPLCWSCHSSAMFDGDPPQMIGAKRFRQLSIGEFGGRLNELRVCRS